MNPNSPESISESISGSDSLPPILPRSAWPNELKYLKTLYQIKQALDRAELTNSSSETPSIG